MTLACNYVNLMHFVFLHCIINLALQNTTSKVSGPCKNISTTTSSFSSKALEMSLKDEAVGMYSLLE